MSLQPLSFEEFFEVQRSRLFGMLTLVTGNRFEAEEIMQDAFLRVWERWDRVSAMQEPGGYLYLTAMNVFRSRYRRAALALRRTAAVAPTEDALATVEDRDLVVRALRGLSPRQRAAIVLTVYAGFTSEEAGRALGMQAGTVRTLATRAKHAMRERAEELR
jgi:RNA polymerase sigma-70 factor (ECF subfamily)